MIVKKHYVSNKYNRDGDSQHRLMYISSQAACIKFKIPISTSIYVIKKMK